MDLNEIARVAVKRIVTDLRDRKGLKQEWGMIHPEIQDEIRDVWGKIIVQEIRKQWREALD